MFDNSVMERRAVFIRLPILYGTSKTIGLVAAIIPQQQISIKLAAQKRAFERFLKSSFYQGGVANCVNNYYDAAVSTWCIFVIPWYANNEWDFWPLFQRKNKGCWIAVCSWDVLTLFSVCFSKSAANQLFGPKINIGHLTLQQVSVRASRQEECKK